MMNLSARTSASDCAPLDQISAPDDVVLTTPESARTSDDGGDRPTQRASFTTQVGIFDACAMAIVTISMIFCMPDGWAPYSAPRAGAMLLFVPVSVWLLVRLVRAGDRAAWAVA